MERFARLQILYYLLYFVYAPFIKYSNTFNSTFFYFYVLLIYICIQFALVLLLTYSVLLCFPISTVILNFIISHICTPIYIYVLSAAHSSLLTYVLSLIFFSSSYKYSNTLI